MQLFLKFYCSANNITRAEPANEPGKINMAAVLAMQIFTFLTTFCMYTFISKLYLNIKNKVQGAHILKTFANNYMQ